MKRTILSVGQCAADHAYLSRLIEGPCDAHLVPVSSIDEARQQIGANSFDLVLVNRIFDATSEQGLELIQWVYQNDSAERPPVMLVSDIAAAQQQAEQLGAVSGFGKSSPRDLVVNRIESALHG